MTNYQDIIGNIEVEYRAWDIEKKIMIPFDQMAVGSNGIVFFKDFFNMQGYINMRYTGMKDKNGKKIFEGDIVKIDELIVVYQREGLEDGLPDCRIEIVLFNNGIIKVGSDCLFDYEGDVEIIGNVFENPDLLPN